MSGLLAIYDRSGKLGLTDPSPGGSSVPLRFRGHVDAPWRVRWEDALEDGAEWHEDGRLCKASSAAQALLLRTEDGTVDPIGMARAREVLARVMRLDPREGVCFALDHGPQWFIQTPFAAYPVGPAVYVENAPEALARLLAEHAGCEVIRG